MAATVIAGILTTSGGAQVPGEQTFKIIEGSGGTFKFVDTAPKAKNPRNPRFSVGDALIFTTPLFNEAKTRIGTVHVYCAVTVGGKNFSPSDPPVQRHLRAPRRNAGRQRRCD